MEKEPLISVITVTYNAEPVIEPTLRSLEEQTFRDFEHIVVDGASKDQTLKLVKAAKLQNSRMISEPDKGLYDAMNKGLKMAKGKYVVFLNAGDAFYDNDTLFYYAEEAKRERDIIYGDTIIVNSEREEIGKRHLSAPKRLTKKSFSEGMLICHQAFMVRRELAPLYDTTYRFSADYDWCVKCIEKADPSKCANLERETVRYLSEGMTDRNKIKSLKERFRIMSKHYGTLNTILNHLGFAFRALRRGSI